LQLAGCTEEELCKLRVVDSDVVLKKWVREDEYNLETDRKEEVLTF
jgi:hypothetical protein